MDAPALIFAAIGITTLLAALLPRLLRHAPISLPMVFLAAGAVAFSVIGALPDPDPREHPGFTLHLTEVCVIISLMGAGLALNRPIGWRRWSTTWRLLGIAMPLTMLVAGLLGSALLGFGVAAAALLAAAVAPTDPVLATEVQVAEPTEGPDQVDDEARFALTSEAGLNDGLAFPFVYAAIAISLAGPAPSGWFLQWLALDVVWRLSAGILAGLAVGWLLRKLIFGALSERLRLAHSTEGFVALAATFLTYGFTELINGYGFVAVFVCACTIRAGERSHSYHQVLHQYVEQLERLLTVAILILLGGAAVSGLLTGVRWQEVLVALLLILLVRPVSGLIGLARGKTGPRERRVIAFFGVRGIGSLFYIAFAVTHGDFPEQDALWRIICLVVIGSVLIHGVTAAPVMDYLDRERVRTAKARTGDPDQAPVTPI
jgi:NhaP-type Na+/H+ or K+/H+ antiporter